MRAVNSAIRADWELIVCCIEADLIIRSSKDTLNVCVSVYVQRDRLENINRQMRRKLH